MNIWKVIFATVVIFGAGVVTGGLLVKHSERMGMPDMRSAPGATRPSPSFSAGGMRLEFLRRVQKDLDLTPGQRERIDEILARSQERTKKLMDPVLPQMRQEIQQAKEEFREVLTPEQRIRFDQLLKNRELHRPGRDKASRPGSASNQPSRP